MLKRILWTLTALIVCGLIIFFGYVPKYIDQNKNTVTTHSRPEQNDFYRGLSFIADLHCDMLLWDRDFLKENNYGHIDLPRMQQSNMAFQAFTIVSKTPRNMNIEHNESNSDQIGLLSFSQMRPPSAWFSLKDRALDQCAQLHSFANNSNNQFRVITNKQQLKSFIHDRSQNNKLTAGMLGLEGAHCLEGNINNLYAFYNAGVRYIGLTHFFDNEWAGSAHGVKKDGLTKEGRKLVEKMDSLHIIIDLAHASTKTIDEILQLTKSPLIVSHTGVRSMCNNQRNLSDEHLKLIGERQGLVGIGLWETAVCGTDAKATVQSIRYVVNKIGIDKVALGSDFDGAIQAPFDVTGLPLIVKVLQEEGFNSEEIDKIMGGNIRDFLLRTLPE